MWVQEAPRVMLEIATRYELKIKTRKSKKPKKDAPFHGKMAVF
jgi:hypothetical protein